MEYKTTSEIDEERMINQVRDLAQIMKDMGLTVLEWTKMDKVRLERPPDYAAADFAPSSDIKATAPATAAASPAPAAKGTPVKSPMVGTFYAAPGPDKPPYVQVGDVVTEGQVLCVIEAMKMMNDITAECDGVVTEICCENKQLVEFNQVLFRIDTSL